MIRVTDVEDHRPPIRGLCETGFEIAGLVAGIAGAAMSAAGTIYGGMQQAQGARQQAQIAEQQAQEAQVAGAAAEQQTRDRSQQLMAAQRAAIGGTGVTEEGTPLMTLMDTASRAELDALRARYTGQVRSFGEMQQAALLRQRAGQYPIAAGIGAGSTLLTGAGRLGLASTGRGRLLTNDPYAGLTD